MAGDPTDHHDMQSDSQGIHVRSRIHFDGIFHLFGRHEEGSAQRLPPEREPDGDLILRLIVIPKSDSFTDPFFPTRRLAGLMSRWITFRNEDT